jgi:hypothetical protein
MELDQSFEISPLEEIRVITKLPNSEQSYKVKVEKNAIRPEYSKNRWRSERYEKAQSTIT